MFRGFLKLGLFQLMLFLTSSLSEMTRCRIRQTKQDQVERLLCAVTLCSVGKKGFATWPHDL
ncbi:hypothetical protein BC938DRAFT_480225 [Jimgerdemannia flammicorona]|uniref:Uncharacterized protein n=1 Tax=Jimgerdemannia flammicorona TaxID=994334 RepID=A0A433QJ03_9FUNG|nr:hypothetical protein BC938DRAFT_480225 [Jimgerdemannia flammicorona]